MIGTLSLSAHVLAGSANSIKKISDSAGNGISLLTFD